MNVLLKLLYEIACQELRWTTIDLFKSMILKIDFLVQLGSSLWRLKFYFHSSNRDELEKAT